MLESVERGRGLAGRTVNQSGPEDLQHVKSGLLRRTQREAVFGSGVFGAGRGGGASVDPISHSVRSLRER